MIQQLASFRFREIRTRRSQRHVRGQQVLGMAFSNRPGKRNVRTLPQDRKEGRKVGNAVFHRVRGRVLHVRHGLSTPTGIRVSGGVLAAPLEQQQQPDTECVTTTKSEIKILAARKRQVLFACRSRITASRPEDTRRILERERACAFDHDTSLAASCFSHANSHLIADRWPSITRLRRASKFL